MTIKLTESPTNKRARKAERQRKAEWQEINSKNTTSKRGSKRQTEREKIKDRKDEDTERYLERYKETNVKNQK